MNAKLKKTIELITCRSAFSQRNVTSILLVALFFAVYVMAGGKISTKVPSFQDVSKIGGGLGGPVSSGDVEEQELASEPAAVDKLDIEKSRGILGVKPSKDRVARQHSQQRVGTLFTDEEVAEAENAEVKKEGLISGVDFTTRREKWLLEKSERKPEDSLSRIEERLKIHPKRGGN